MMRITIKAAKYPLTLETEAMVEEKLATPIRLLGEEGDNSLLDIEVEHAPAEGRSSTPARVVANLTVGGKVFHAEAVKPTPESAADRVRSELESEIRKQRGRTRRFLRKGSATIKNILRGEF